MILSVVLVLCVLFAIVWGLTLSMWVRESRELQELLQETEADVRRHVDQAKDLLRDNKLLTARLDRAAALGTELVQQKEQAERKYAAAKEELVQATAKQYN